MTLEKFFSKHPEAAIIMFRRRKLWYASLCKNEDDAPILIARAQNHQVALGNLAAQLAHWKEPQQKETQ